MYIQYKKLNKAFIIIYWKITSGDFENGRSLKNVLILHRKCSLLLLPFNYSKLLFCFQRTMIIQCVCMASLFLTFTLTEKAGEWMYFIWVCLMFGTFCGNFALFPTATAKAFGHKYFTINYGMVFSSQVWNKLFFWVHFVFSWGFHVRKFKPSSHFLFHLILTCEQPSSPQKKLTLSVS